MIRQAISCDICGAEKKQTNHWFVAHEQPEELRVSRWGSRNRTRPGAKHLCGQTCLHKLVDDFMARDLAAMQRGVVEDCEMEEQAESIAASLTPDPVVVEAKRSARPLPPPVPILPQQIPFRTGVGLVAVPKRIPVEEPAPAPPDDPPGARPRKLRGDAWERERERELRAMESRSDIVARRRLGS